MLFFLLLPLILLRKGEDTLYLPRSYELDNAPSFERFYFLYSVNIFDVEKVLKDFKQSKQIIDKKIKHFIINLNK